jgi:UDP-N-acetyl-D-mannosaminuronic acid transferase (WecB/TagA/CpsF family)
MNEFRIILGFKCFVGSLEALLMRTQQGGLIVVPAAPALADLEENPEYRRALENATFAITDSSLLVLLWFVRKGEWLTRISGLCFLRGLVEHPPFRKKRATFWIMPSPADLEANARWLNKQGFSIDMEDCYLAPLYPKGSVVDEALLQIIELKKPAYIVINIGGGTQEILGLYLHSRLSYKPAIICTGAAIAFLSGRQVNIPSWADKLMLGWLLRCLSEPRKFFPRYMRGCRFIRIFFEYVERPVSPA